MDANVRERTGLGQIARVLGVMIGLTNSTFGLVNDLDRTLMKEVAVYEAKTRFSELLTEVEGGEQVIITRRGLPIARLVSVVAAKRGAASQRQRVSATIASLREERQGVVLEGLLSELIADGRD